MRNYTIVLACLLWTACNSNLHYDNKAHGNDTITDKGIKQAENKSIDTILKVDENFKQFIPKGFHLIHSYSADLNMDSLEDKLILCEQDSGKNIGTTKIDSNLQERIRPLIILLRQKDKTLKKHTVNNNIIFSEPSTLYGGDAFDDIYFKSGQFSISYAYHMGDHIISKQLIFNYSKKEKDWFLYKFTSNSKHHNPSNPDDIKEVYNLVVKTKDFGKIKFRDFNRTMIEEYE